MDSKTQVFESVEVCRRPYHDGIARERKVSIDLPRKYKFARKMKVLHRGARTFEIRVQLGNLFKEVYAREF